MSIDLDDEILQDFLVEAGEILELLNEQLVDLEQTPEDADLLNAVFRGFHTVKGGAGFLAIDPMVDTCHVCEDVFNVLRQGDRVVSPPLMDAVLQGLDCVQTMFAEIQSGQEPTPAAPELLATLKMLLLMRVHKMKRTMSLKPCWMPWMMGMKPVQHQPVPVTI